MFYILQGIGKSFPRGVDLRGQKVIVFLEVLIQVAKIADKY